MQAESTCLFPTLSKSRTKSPALGVSTSPYVSPYIPYPTSFSQSHYERDIRYTNTKCLMNDLSSLCYFSALSLTQVIKNCRVLASALQSRGNKLVLDGINNRLLLWDLRPRNIDGARFERIGELCEITLNKTTYPKDKSALVPEE